MPFVQAARNFINNPGTHQTKQHYPLMIDTLNFLLNNAIGIQNAVSTQAVINHLASLGHQTHREDWQINVLGYLRENGVFIASKIGGGIFLINNASDAYEAFCSYFRRIAVETERLNLLYNHIRQAGWLP